MLIKRHFCIVRTKGFLHGRRIAKIDRIIYQVIMLFGIFGIFSGCSTLGGAPNLSLQDAIAEHSTLRIPFVKSEKGLMIIEVEITELGLSKFIIDTGATASGVFKQSLTPNITLGPRGNDVRVHGISKSEMRQTLQIQYVNLAGQSFDNKQFVLLEKPEHDEYLLNQTVGVIGLDVLSRYKVLIDPPNKILFLIDKQIEGIYLGESWNKIPMSTKPYNIPAYGLPFLKLNVNGIYAYALFDTGAEYNVMNWNFKHLWQLTLRRQSLERQWEHSGALGQFDPVGLAILDGISVEGYKWPKQSFSVFDLNTFNVIGLEDKPLMITGMPFFQNHPLLLDFSKQTLWIKSNE